MTISLTAANAFAIKIKYSKTTLFIPVTPTTTYPQLKSEIISILSKSSQELPSSVGYHVAELQKDGDLLDQVVGLFFGEKKDQDSSSFYIFQSVEERVSGDSSKITVGKLGLKEGKNEVLYMGFKSKDGDEISNPEVQEPSLLDDEEEEEEEEEDPDSRPSPPNLDDGEDVIMEDAKGKGKAKARR